MNVPVLYQMGIAVALGLLVGLQRERALSGIAGIRTFPLIALFGAISGVLGHEYGGWIIGAGLIAVTTLIAVANVIQLETREVSEGMTTEFAALVMFVIGAALTTSYMLEAVVASAVVALLLHWKAPLHAFAERMGKADFAALMQFTLFTLVILPVLPNRTYGPFHVINPFDIWTMVVLIVGISMAGYVAFKLFGERTGALAAGLLGGLISSTATTVSYAQRTARRPGRSAAAGVVILLASTVVFGRMFVELAVVAPGVLGATAPPLLAMMGAMMLITLVLYRAGMGAERPEVEDHDPPANLKSALLFGFLYAVVLLAVAFSEARFGRSGLYAVAALSGLTDIDAITLSTAQLMKSGNLAPEVGWRVILVGGMANLAFKGGVVSVIGAPALRRRVILAFGAALAAGGSILIFWPV